jgi:hypothetical protein
VTREVRSTVPNNGEAPSAAKGARRRWEEEEAGVGVGVGEGGAPTEGAGAAAAGARRGGRARGEPAPPHRRLHRTPPGPGRAPQGAHGTMLRHHHAGVASPLRRRCVHDGLVLDRLVQIHASIMRADTITSCITVSLKDMRIMVAQWKKIYLQPDYKSLSLKPLIVFRIRLIF